MGEDLAAVGGHQHVVLDTNASPVGQVHARLNCDYHARLERGIRLFPEPWSLMNIHPQPVSQPVVKKTAETCFLDDGAGFGIDVVGLDARPDRGNSAFLCRQHCSIDSSRTWL